MAKISINPGDNIQAIIDASKPRDRVIFQDGIYAPKKTLQFKSNRYYIAHANLFVNDTSLDFMIEVVADEPFEPSLFQRAMAWARRLLRLPKTRIHGFVLHGAGIKLTDMDNCNVERCMISHSRYAICRN